MKAVILVGGKATRLLPLTSNIPKAMVPVLNIPFLVNVIRHLNRHGIDEIIMAQGHLAQPMEGFLGDGSQFGVKLHYSIEDTPLGTAGAIKHAAGFIDGTFLVLNGDVFTDLDVSGMIDFHRKNETKITIALTPVDDPTSYGLVETNADGRITRFLEKPAPDQITTNMINAGTYVLEPELMDDITPRLVVSFEREVFPGALERKEPVYAYSSSAYWIDIGTPEQYMKLHRDLLGGKSRQYSLVSDREVLFGEKVNVHREAHITGPAVIGSGCTIGRDVKIIGPVSIGDGCNIHDGSIVEGSVIWRDAELGKKTLVRDSILAENCRLMDGSVCRGAVLGDNVVVNSNCRVEQGKKIWPGTIVDT